MSRSGTLALVRLAPLAAAALLSACPDDPPPPPVPQILEFSATPSAVRPNQTTQLRYQVKDAASVTIDIMGGANVLPLTNAQEGTVASPPLDRSTTFVLKASNGAGDSSKTLVVNVETGMAVITSLLANPSTVDPGQSSTLSWTTEGAVSGEIREGATVITTLNETRIAAGSYVLDNITQTRNLTLAAKGSDGSEATRMVTITVNGPQILAFEATPNVIDSGQASTLSWNVTNATTVDVAGPASGMVVTGGPVPTGSVQVMPTATETFTLTAKDGAGRTATRTVQVSVNPFMGAHIDRFVANPTSVGLGMESALEWQVRDAPGGVQITAPGLTATTSPSLTGTLRVRPRATTTYTLTALNPAGNASAQVTVDVTAAAPLIQSFTASPNPGPLNGSTTLSWVTFGADRVRILSGARELVNTTANVDSGSALVGLTVTSTVFLLEATNAAGGNTATVQVAAHEAPIINSFTANPRIVMGPTTVTLAWSASRTSRVELLANGQPAPGFTPIDTGAVAGEQNGSFPISVSSSTRFELVVSSGGGQARATALVSALVPEIEPNDTATTAGTLPGDGSGATGALGPQPGDRDWYVVAVPAGGNIRAETSDGQGGCAVDTFLDLIGPDQTTVLASDDDGGADACSLVDPRLSAGARDLAAGSYYVRVRGFSVSDTGPYVLTVLVSPPACGNGLTERRAPTAEECDDANTSAGDGCDASCQAETLQTFTGPVASFTVGGSIGSLGQRAFYEIVMTTSGYVRAETFAPSAPVCSNTDTLLRLYDASFQELGSDDEDGVGSCSLIDPSGDTFAFLLPGTYYLSVEDYQRDGLIPAYTLDLRLLGVGCGNTVIEAGEQCDDGDTMSGDGCSATCVFEGTSENEAGGNNTFNGPGVVQANMNSVLRGVITPAGDQDWFAVTVPQGFHLEAVLTVQSMIGCASSPAPQGRLRLYGTNGTTELASNSASGTTCATISPFTTLAAFEMNAGTYFLRVSEVNDDATITPYFLHLRLIAPACGNGIPETTEQCEDGNATAGDGCSPTCTFEINPTIVTAPGASVAVNLPTADSFAIIRVNITQAGQSIAAVAADAPAAASCANVDTALNLGGALFNLIGGKADGGPSGAAGDCAAFLVPADGFSTDLAVGTYYVVVLSEGGAGPVQVNVTISNPACGNGILERSAGESCDDNNTVPGDGCSATCTGEPDLVVTLPGPQAMYAGSIAPVGDVDLIQIDVSAAVYLRAETAESFAGTVASCPTADTLLRLFDGANAPLGSNDDGGVGACSLMLPTDGYTRLAPGRYFLTIEEYNNDGQIAAYQLRIDGVLADVCGNTVIEGTEACDDGNTQPNDGCSPTCQVEFGTPETEPNELNSANGPMPLGPIVSDGMVGGPSTVIDLRASIAQAGDEDWFTFTVPAGGASVAIFTYAFTVPGVYNTCGFDTQMWLYNGVPSNLMATSSAFEPTIVEYDDDDWYGTCSRISGNESTNLRRQIPAGTYYLRTRRNIPGVIASYYVHLDIE